MTSFKRSREKDDKELSEADAFGVNVPITIGLAALDQAALRPPGWVPERQKGDLGDLTSAALALDADFSHGIAPSPMGSSHPDMQREDTSATSANKLRSNPNAKQKTSITSSGDKQLVLEPNRSGGYITKGELNGQPVIYLVDTGASVVSVPARIARLADLERTGPGHIAHTANGTIEVFAALAQEVKIGDGIVLNAIECSINPAEYGDKILLGMSALKHLDVQIRQGKMILRQKHT